MQPRPPDMITGVTGGSAKNESSSSLDDVTTQPTIIIYPTGNKSYIIIKASQKVMYISTAN